MKARVADRPLSPAGVLIKLVDIIELTKPRIASLVMVTTLAGSYMASTGRMDLAVALHALVGTGLVAGGANALNEIIERRYDALMLRTAHRPLPAERLSVAEALGFALLISLGGVAYLAATTNLLAASLAAISLVLYVGVYTPLKRVTPFNTAVGAVPGALPPLIGWAAATGELTHAAWVLFAIIYLWQLPHFFAIAWIYREDYARGGFKMLPVVDPSGDSTVRQILTQGLALLVVSLLPTLLDMTGRTYFFCALALGIVFWALGWAVARRRTISSARRLVLASIIYLPLLLTAMMLDRA